MNRMLAFVLLPSLATAAAPAESVKQTRHNLSVNGPGSIKATTETRICVFCHVPHRGHRLGENRPESAAKYTPYASTTLASHVPGAPDGATRMCLSCHDGTIAVGETIASGRIAMRNTSHDGRIPDTSPSNIGTDLRKTHPVSFIPIENAKVHRPRHEDEVRLDNRGELQCTACHDPHRENADPLEGKFLVKSNQTSALCVSCHTIPFWATNPSSHQASLTTFGVAEGSTTRYRSVAENGCMACHKPHGATERGRLVKPARNGSDDEVCLACHSTRVARLDVARQVGKPFGHAAPQGAASGHDASEGPRSTEFRLPEARPGAPRHVTCVDCHNPHAAFKQTAVAPKANGTLSGVWGIDRNGQRIASVQFEYEVCFKCHADSGNQPQGLPSSETLRRAMKDVNLRRVFDPAAPSYHPVIAPGRNLKVPGLIGQGTSGLRPESQLIYCSDCHASDEQSTLNGNVPRGPHGSIYPHLLERNYSTVDHTPESPIAYALCYKCHDRDVLFSPASAFTQSAQLPARPNAVSLHDTHVRGDNDAPCSACHASHGVSMLSGNPINNARLIDFDVSIVKPSKNGLRQYTNRGGSGSCTLTCHGHDHASAAYP